MFNVEDLVPELVVDFTLVSSNELIEYWQKALDIGAERISRRRERLQPLGLLTKTLPIIDRAQKMNVSNATSRHKQTVVKVFLERVHDRGARQKRFDFARCRKVGRQQANNVVMNTAPNFGAHALEKSVPAM